LKYFRSIIIIATALCLTACSSDQAEVPDYVPAQEAAKSDADKTEENNTSEPTEPKEEDKKDETSASDTGYKELIDKHVRIRLKNEGKDVFALWGFGRPDYRYGPSIMLDKDGGIHAWFASPGDGKKEYDWITYRHSDDGGKTWGEEKVVLSPTPGSADYKSVCDPDAFYYDGYYYLGYTGTINCEGLCNNVFIARSKNPDGPYEKWDGNGWGGTPVPIVYYNGVDIGWGVGEPSFVVVDDKLYAYNTLDSFSEIYGWVRATRVRTVDLTDPMWPKKLELEGTSIYRNDCTDSNNYTYEDSDSWDVAYLEDSHKFIALSTNRRFKDDSCLLYYESYDGISFDRVSELNTNVISGCHNCGIMTDGYGHIRKDDPKMIGYAYAGSGLFSWGAWATRFVSIDIDYTDDYDRDEDDVENLKMSLTMDETLLGKDPIMLTCDQLTYTSKVDQPIYPKYYVINEYRNKAGVSPKEVTVEKYDRNVIKVTDDGQFIPIREGVTTVGVEYNGLRRDICIRVLPDECDDSQIKRFYPICDHYDIKVNEPIILKVRPMAVFGNYDIREMSGYELTAYEIEFKSSNPYVCTVEKDGTIKPIQAGDAVITVSAEGCRCTIDVHVTD